MCSRHRVKSSISYLEITSVVQLGSVGIYVILFILYADSFGDQVYYKNVSWTPSSNQVGQHIFCFKALDKIG